MNKSKAEKQAPPQKVAPKTVSWKDRISSQDYEELKATFDLFDEDGGGTIDPVQIEKILDELGLKGRSSVVFQIINSLKQTNKSINFEQFLNIVCTKVGDTKTRDGLGKVFQIWDRHGNGSIDFQSFKTVARQLGETLNDEELNEMMHNAYIINHTQSHDSFSFEEFYNVVTKKR